MFMNGTTEAGIDQLTLDPALSGNDAWLVGWQPGDPIPVPPSTDLTAPDVITKETAAKAADSGDLTPQEYELIAQAIDAGATLIPSLVEIILKATNPQNGGNGTNGAGAASPPPPVTASAGGQFPWAVVLSAAGGLALLAFLARGKKT